MEKNERISKSLGLTQEQLAMLLGISRGQLSMFELGLRPLPEAANDRLREIKAIAENTKANRPSFKENSPQHKVFTGLLEENGYQQQLLTAKLAWLNEKHSNGLKGQALLDYLASESENEKGRSFLFMPPKSRNASYMMNSGLVQIMQCEIQLKVLQYEAQLLKKAMGGKG